ncbi:AraC family transcriptional regulator [Methylobacterium indicum]|uniref:GlxA family transcriptional regulator n=1 Tax=Methylobacterium indicum TaxID=1775910 RepID=UPI00073482C2|nr:helix-turn-helix domain-containing protein [Methylobacterium indicum]KTS24783.1 AraC family transcriptional regulator [Methylobacterium indicum]KTS38831.1 AraC family transcriptional regulator [Methylobacterium indicum]KTS53167.1 AraC family transcriptional regulator [Methylobacterium indicum]
MSGPAEIPVVVVCPPRTLLLDVAGPIEVLRKANLIQEKVRFRVGHVGPSPTVTSSIGLGLSGLGPLPAPLPDGATVVLAGTAERVLGDPDPPGETERAAEDAIVAWLRAEIRPGHRLVSICSGALLAARAGLLDGHACTTHHAACAELAALAPAARVLEDRLFVEDRERLTSAGITAGIDLMLHLVARLVDPACAAAVARYLVVYLRRSGHDPQLSPWLTGRNHLHPAIHRVQDAVSADPARAWSLEALAGLAATSPRHLSRLFNRHAGMSLPSYINGLRVALARDLLAQTRLDMERVAERAGFASPRQLRRAWSRVNDGPPRAVRDG